MPLRKPDLPSNPRMAVRWVRDHLPDVRLPDVHMPALKTPTFRAPDLRGDGREAVAWIVDRLPRAPARRRAPEASALILPAVLAAAGAGAAFWWWTQWSRGREEARLAEEGAEEGAAHPEHIMDHAPPPPSEGEAPNPSDARLQVPAEDIMAHAPLPKDAKPRRKLKKVGEVVAPVAKQALTDSLAVQASTTEPEPGRPAEAPST